MTEIFDFLTRFLPVEIAIIAVIFIYILILFKKISDKIVSLTEKQATLAETQTHYIQDRLDVVEKFLGISDQAIKLKDVHIQELERIANQREADTIKTQKALDEAQERLITLELRQNELLYSSNLQPEQVNTIKEVQLNLQQLTVELATQKIVHELQTRLQAIISLSENMADETFQLKPSDLRHEAKRILNKAEALATIVNNLGEFQQEYRFKLTKLHPIFSRAWEIYQDEARDRNIKLKIKLEKINGAEPELDLSPRHMELAINNLINNAIKYSYTGSKDKPKFIEIIGRGEKNYYVVSISNYGIGIKRDEIEKGLIFQDGYQGKLTQGEYRTGTGKGLTFAKSVIDNHKGRILIESDPIGEISEVQPHLNTITISLPYKQIIGETQNVEKE